MFYKIEYFIRTARHFGSYEPGKLRGTPHKGRNSAVKSSQLSWAGQHKKCVQYDFKFTSVYSAQVPTLPQFLNPRNAMVKICDILKNKIYPSFALN